MREAIILAGGFGTRLRSVVSDLPKPMAPVSGRPFLCHVLDNLAGFDHVVLATGYMHDAIEQHFGDTYNDIALSYARETTPLGTGGAILNALRHCDNDVVTVLNGDTLFRIDHHALEHLFDHHSTRLTLVLRHVDDTSRYGAVAIDGTGRITSFVEKSASHGNGLINGGIYRLHRTLFDHFAPGSNFSFEKDVMQHFVGHEDFYALTSDAYFIDIGIPEDYARAQEDLKQTLLP